VSEIVARQERREAIDTRELKRLSALEAAIKALPPELQIKEQLFHHFAEGLYAREMRVPAGSVVVGKMHKYPCINLIMAGTMEVRSTTGRSIRINAPYIFTSPAGTKRAGYAVTDLTWVTVHPSKTTDLEQLEAELIISNVSMLPSRRVMVLEDIL
jgi:hypothetical protein